MNKQVENTDLCEIVQTIFATGCFLATVLYTVHFSEHFLF